MGYSWTPDQGKKWLIPKGIEMNPEEYVQFAVNVINGANKLIEMKGLDGTNT